MVMIGKKRINKKAQQQQKFFRGTKMTGQSSFATYDRHPVSFNTSQISFPSVSGASTSSHAATNRNPLHPSLSSCPTFSATTPQPPAESSLLSPLSLKDGPDRPSFHTPSALARALLVDPPLSSASSSSAADSRRLSDSSPRPPPSKKLQQPSTLLHTRPSGRNSQPHRHPSSKVSEDLIRLRKPPVAWKDEGETDRKMGKENIGQVLEGRRRGVGRGRDAKVNSKELASVFGGFFSAQIGSLQDRCAPEPPQGLVQQQQQQRLQLHKEHLQRLQGREIQTADAQRRKWVPMQSSTQDRKGQGSTSHGGITTPVEAEEHHNSGFRLDRLNYPAPSFTRFSEKRLSLPSNTPDQQRYPSSCPLAPFPPSPPSFPSPPRRRRFAEFLKDSPLPPDPATFRRRLDQQGATLSSAPSVNPCAAPPFSLAALLNPHGTRRSGQAGPTLLPPSKAPPPDNSMQHPPLPSSAPLRDEGASSPPPSPPSISSHALVSQWKLFDATKNDSALKHLLLREACDEDEVAEEEDERSVQGGEQEKAGLDDNIEDKEIDGDKACGGCWEEREREVENSKETHEEGEMRQQEETSGREGAFDGSTTRRTDESDQIISPSFPSHNASLQCQQNGQREGNQHRSATQKRGDSEVVASTNPNPTSFNPAHLPSALCPDESAAVMRLPVVPHPSLSPSLSPPPAPRLRPTPTKLTPTALELMQDSRQSGEGGQQVMGGKEVEGQRDLPAKVQRQALLLTEANRKIARYKKLIKDMMRQGMATDSTMIATATEMKENTPPICLASPTDSPSVNTSPSASFLLSLRAEAVRAPSPECEKVTWSIDEEESRPKNDGR